MLGLGRLSVAILLGARVHRTDAGATASEGAKLIGRFLHFGIYDRAKPVPATEHGFVE
jgi:hypothetical protein